jgi:hypothetical protein
LIVAPKEVVLILGQFCLGIPDSNLTTMCIFQRDGIKNLLPHRLAKDNELLMFQDIPLLLINESINENGPVLEPFSFLVL